MTASGLAQEGGETHWPAQTRTCGEGFVSMDMRYAPLLESRLFFGIPPRWIEERVLPLCTEREYPAGAQLIAQHDAVREIGIILSGRIQILQLFPDGKSSLMRVLRPGEWIGLDLAYTRTGISPYHAIASEASRVLYMPSNLLFSVAIWGEETAQELTGRVLRIISHDNIKKHYRIAILSRHGLRERIMMYLSMQANRRNALSFDIPFSREELADYLCVNRSVLSHELTRMEKEGLIRFRKNHFELLSDGFQIENKQNE